MNDTNCSLQLEELESLLHQQQQQESSSSSKPNNNNHNHDNENDQTYYYSLPSIVVTTPKLLERRKKLWQTNQPQPIHVVKPIELEVSIPYKINDNNNKTSSSSFNGITTTMHLVLPIDYPTESIPDVMDIQLSATDATSKTTRIRKEELMNEVYDFLEDFPNRGRCILNELIEFVQQLLETTVTTGATKNNNNNTITKTSTASTTNDDENRIWIAKFNHLLQGPSHKKEASMVKLLKSYSFSGGMAIVYGTPGLVVVQGGTLVVQQDLVEFVGECKRSIGKTCDDSFDITALSSSSSSSSSSFFSHSSKVETKTLEDLKQSFDGIMDLLL